MSIIERCHFVAYSFVFPALPSLSAVRCIVTARPLHSSTPPTLQNTNNQEDPSIPRFPSRPPPRLCLVDPHVPTLSLFSRSLFIGDETAGLSSNNRRDVLYSLGAVVIRVSGYVRRFASRLSAVLLPIRERKRERKREKRVML